MSLVKKSSMTGDKILEQNANIVSEHLRSLRKRSRFPCLTFSLLGVKLLSFFTSLIQLIVLYMFMQLKFSSLVDLLNFNPSNIVLPYVTFCDFMSQDFGNFHNQSVQCLLSINVFNEKIFILLSYWLLALTIITFFDFFYWTIGSLPFFQRRFLRPYLADVKALGAYLGSDGIVLLGFISKENFLFAEEVVKSLNSPVIEL